MSTPETDTDNGQTAKQRTAAQLESRAHAALRTAPALQAPSMLETRVYRELMRRAARPWWLRGFGSWPLGIQLLFLPLSAGFIKLAFLTAAGVSSAAGAASLSPLANTAQGHWQSLISAARTLQTVATLATRAIPQYWIYGAAGVTLMLYAALFGLGAIAFRSLIATPQDLRY